MLWVFLACAVALASGCGPNHDIVSGLDQLEANEILVVLRAKGIDGEKVKEEGRVVTFAVLVKDVDVDDALRLLVANKLPRTRSQGLKEVYPPGGGGLIPTKSEEKAKFLMAMQGEIERKLKAMPGIVQAHVSVVQPDKDIVRDLDTPPPPATASVAVVFNAIDERGSATVKEDEVRSLVAASIEDLRPANVTVVMKKNAPGNLIDDVVSSSAVEQAPAAATAFGLKLADKGSWQRLQLFAVGFLAVTVLGIAFGMGGLVRSMGLKKRVAKAEAELASVRKAGRATQTGLQAPPA
ncbi:MAG: hypothetical protein A2138_14425 [Deltaproteobacteria bacterium RBG_16_71_12]|nr:MAG: hypothetical protein A2138_14425 [Deltaproteobacteria bacterium RBG_16_71_12]